MASLKCSVVLLWASWFAHVTMAWGAEIPVDFESQVAPLLIRKCVECHQGREPAGGLRLTSRAGLLAGGDSGPAFDAEAPENSLMLQRVRDGEMPPEKQGKPQPLRDHEVKILEPWLAAGAPWPEQRQLDWFERTTDVRAGRDWWSLQPIVRPQLPELAQPTENPIDVFVLAEQARHGMVPAPPADKRTLLRRAYYDLIGLPPSEAEIDAFVSDESPDAWPNVIDRLLAMPQYGERWGRYWLDLTRYADTSGYERDQEKPFAWKYRDWVVRALNEDKPYDEFIVEQLAGDEIESRTVDSVIATGFLRLGAWNDEPNEPLDYEYDRLEDLVHTTSAAFLGLTVNCARCHAHKFDPIMQEDYYRMAAAFWAGPIAARDRALLGGPTADEVGFGEVLAWTDLGPQARPLHVLKNGERDKPLQEVVPASLSTIPSLSRPFVPPPDGSRTTHRRLQLARWIADPQNPLTPRVLVNRLWQHHFGQGIVRTPNNFGFLADPPTHPQLLDWLAAEFLAGGGRIKRMHKLILTSRTWQQSSLHPRFEDYVQQDPTNRLWWRAERRRLDAESLRDSMLAASGELDLTIGGESFRPTISAEALEGLSRKTAAWQASPADEQDRRSLYMYLKRGLLPPLMTAFDLCDATQSCGKRDVTIVPTQALALLNNQFTHDRSEYLAAAILANDVSPADQVRQAWSRILRRQPTVRELELGLRHLAVQREAFSGSPDSTAKHKVPTAMADRLNASLRLQLRADAAQVEGPDHRVTRVSDQSGNNHHAAQADPAAQPGLRAEGFGGQPTLVFDGTKRFLTLEGHVLKDQACTIVCVVNDQGSTGHRAILSNWNRAGNATTSLFLGLTDVNLVRFSDAFASAGQVSDREKPFVLTAVSGSGGAVVYQSGRLLNSLSTPLPARKLDTPWVIGQQGNIGGEYWHGEIAEIRVYDRPLSDDERRAVEAELAERYGLTLDVSEKAKSRTPEDLALASLCHVLLNSNEFVYVD